MNRFNWTYVDDFSKSHQIVLMHGAQSGHLLVCCNAKVILIDFKVLQNKTYSLFIEDELCEIAIERKDNQFLYGFEINKDADTPRNRMRKERDKKHILQSVLFFGGIVASVAIFLSLFFNYQQNKANRLAEEIFALNSSTTFAKVFVDNDRAKYSFIANSKTYTYDSPYQEAMKDISTNGFPLENGDEFELKYATNNPKIHRINYKQPTQHQQEKYLDRAVQKELENNNQILDTSLASCRAAIAYELKGLAGLADLYYQDTPPSDNPLHNELTYKRLVRDVPFQKEFDKKCR